MCHALAVSSARFASFTLVATFHLDLPLVLVGESESVTARANSTNHHVKLARLPPPGGVFRWVTTPNTANWAAQARAVPFSTFDETRFGMGGVPSPPHTVGFLGT